MGTLLYTMPFTFRKLRQRFLAENRVTRYLAYAAGEILLVVIGILIAIQLNSARQEKVQRMETNQLLEGVLADLAMDSVHCRFIYDDFSRRAEALQNMLRMRKGKNAYTNQELGDFVLRANFFESYDKVSSSYESMISSGKLQTLANKTLGESLVNYYTSNGLKITTEIYGQVILESRIHESPHLVATDLLFPDQVFSNVPHYSFNKESSYQSDFKSLLNERWTELYLVNCLNQMVYVFNNLRNEQLRNEALTKSIREYLQENG